MKKVIYVCFVITIAIAVQIGAGKLIQSDNRVFAAFAKTDAQDTYVNLKFVGKYQDGYIVESEQEDIKQYISEKEGFDTDMITIEQQNGNFYISISVKYEVEKIGSAGKEILNIRKQILEECADIGFDMDCYMTITGSIAGKVSDIMADDIVKTILLCLGTDDGDKQSLASERMDCIYYAYSPLLNDYIEVGNTKTNVTIAFTYDEMMDVTRIYLATPILNESI